MERKIIVLANSKRYKERCVAGICIDADDEWKGKWIRPIYEGRSTRAIPEEEVGNINLLDVVEINLTKSETNASNKKNPIENYFIDKKKLNWGKVNDRNSSDKLPKKIEYIKKLCENDDIILHSDEETHDEERMQEIRLKPWKSLMLIEKKVRFVYSERGKKWYGNFDTRNGINIHLPLTDLSFASILEKDSNKKNGNYILTISLAETPSNYDNKYYKLIAGVIDPELI